MKQKLEGFSENFK